MASCSSSIPLKMFKLVLSLLLASPVLCHPSIASPRQRCRYGDDCWPSEQTWQTFNDSVSGRLARNFPSAAACHGQNFNLESCTEAKEEWYNSFWRTNQSGAYTAMAWELGHQQCFVNSSRNAPCQPGLGELQYNQRARHTLLFSRTD